MRSKLRTLLILTLVSLAFLEIALQGAAGLAWQWHKPREEVATSEARQTILCVGDSWTYGIGSSDPSRSYPMQMQKILNAGGTEPRCEVINCGWPGQNSRDVLLKLAGQIEEHDPQIVSIVVGSNDRWSFPEEVDASSPNLMSAAGRSFQWRWRTGRLLDILLSAVKKRFATAKVSEQEGPKLALDPPHPAAGHARASQESRDRALQVHTLMEMGKRAEASQIVTALHEEFAAHPSQPLAEILMRSMNATGDVETGIEFGQRVAELFAQSRVIWGSLAELGFKLDRVALAKHAVDRAVSLPSYAGRAEIINWHHLRSRIYTMGLKQPMVGMTSIITAFLYHRNASRMKQMIRIYASRYNEDNLSAAIDTLELNAEDRQRVQQIGLQALDRDLDRMAEVLRIHLTQMVEACTQRGCKVLISSYPTDHQYYLKVLSEVGANTDAEVLLMRDHFDQLKKNGVKHSELFVPDGHCNDRGYEIMAVLIAAKLRSIQASK